jgi:hypothetical protein
VASVVDAVGTTEVLDVFDVLRGQLHTFWVEPVFAVLALDHQVVWIVRHLTLAIHSNTIWRERSGTCIVVETTEVIICSYILQACVIFEGMNSTPILYSLRTAHVVVVRKKKLFGTMELPASTCRLFRSVVPAHLHSYVLCTIVKLDMLNSSHVWRCSEVWWSQSNRITSYNEPTRKTRLVDKIKEEVTLPPHQIMSNS